MTESTVGVDAGRTITRTHVHWCNRAEHARMVEENCDDLCTSRRIVVVLPDGEELTGWWNQDVVHPLFVVDSPISAELYPHAVRALLTALDGATNPLGKGLCQLLTEALEVLGVNDPARAEIIVLEPSYGEDAVWHRALNIIAVSPRLDAASRERAIDELQAEWLRDQLRTIEAKLEAP